MTAWMKLEGIMLSEKNQRQILYTYIESKKARLRETESRVVVLRTKCEGKWEDVVQVYKLSLIRLFWDVCTANNTVVYNWEKSVSENISSQE